MVNKINSRDADGKSMVSIFDKLIYCPKPDYASRLLMWKHYVQKLSEDQAKQLNYSLLTRESDGMTAGAIQAVCQRILTERRLMKLHVTPLNTQEFMDQILAFPEADAEEAQMFKEFCEKTPMAKKRSSLNEPPEEEASDKKMDSKKKSK